ncbi:MAG: 6-phosphofructokinase [Caldilineae bacterium]|nr:MAG: 6-phosphofructokinase [Caldilineae bacterium]
MAKRLGVLTSGGDAQGMNAAVRAAVRTALDQGADVFAIYEGYEGMIRGGNLIRPVQWGDVGGILHRGGTVFGTARSPAFRTREGRRQAALHLLEHEIDRLIVIGGDGSLTGANILRQEWPELLEELVEAGAISQEIADAHQFLTIVGLVGSIDNDMFGTDMTIGADSALHRITDAIDAISSTAASHQRAFVVEVMGRNCGYLALMSGLASGADWVLIPESPPNLDEWEEKMCQILAEGRKAGRRDSIVVVAEGAMDRHGNPITCEYVKEVLETHLGEEARVTVLGHVQRGGAPSAYDRVLSTLLGAAAAVTALQATASDEPVLIGMHHNKITVQPLMECVEKTHEINRALQERNFDRAMELRGSNFQDAFRILRTLVRALPHPPTPGQRRIRFAVMNASAPAPGMNAAVRAAVRLAVDRGHIPVGVFRGFRGLINEQLEEMDWMSVAGWAPMGGSELGTSRKVPAGGDFYAIARTLEKWNIDAILMIGGWAGYQSMLRLYQERPNFPSFNIPLICVPATINNNLPGTELCIGPDTALNSIVDVVDKIKQSAVASSRCFIVEVMGRYCGYLALMSSMATGAERVYLHEEGVTLKDLERDIELLKQGFSQGKRLGLMIRNENANPLYNTPFLRSLFEEEGGNLFDVRSSVLGHLQQGGNPTPYDRNLATRLAARAVEFIEAHDGNGQADESAACLGLMDGEIRFTPLYEIPRLVEADLQRPKKQWWLRLRPVARILAQPGPGFHDLLGIDDDLSGLFA